MKIEYQAINFKPEKLKKIQQADAIIKEYKAKGYGLTLRQLYYQFVSRMLIPNNEKEYDNLGAAVSDGRMAGLLDWDMITDRLRQIERVSTWDSPADIIATCANQFRLDKWARQPNYVEVWIEKDALVGVIEPTCRTLEVPYMACRGYISSSAVWEAGHQRFKPQLEEGKECHLLYLGDHDPSGIDMTRDVLARIGVFAEGDVNVQRLALNMSQVEEFSPPPNPTKLSDCRAKGYIKEYGHTCWELDALDPAYISGLVTTAVTDLRDDALWDAGMAEQGERRQELALTSKHWDKVLKMLKKIQPEG